MQSLIPPTPDDLVAAQLRLAKAKDLNDEAQAELRAARATATAALKEQAQALRNWRQIVRGIDGLPDDEFEDEDEAEEDDEEEEDDADPNERQPAEPLPAGAPA